ncbi:MAG TPA: methyltransferase domain-containing protein [Acidimicrobiales bacterium]|nr:methyltransferase domain-containing protein [Acidimicrobiales bacterium]
MKDPLAALVAAAIDDVGQRSVTDGSSNHAHHRQPDSALARELMAATEHAMFHGGAYPLTRFRAVKQRLLRLARPFLERQSVFNTAATAATVQLATQLRELRQDVALLRRELTYIKREPNTGVAIDAAVAVSPVRRLSDHVYAAFEEKFRGTAQDVGALQSEYLPIAMTLPTDAGPILDIGSGRGEWLDLLRRSGLPAYGLDTNAGFVAASVERGLDVRQEDGLQHLRALPRGSLAGVTAFHVVEHLEPEQVLQLVEDAALALAPGGALILETPNPQNLLVGSSTFYLDPTHRRPVHPLYLQFIVDKAGFDDAEILPLHPADPSCKDVGVTPAATPDALVTLVNGLLFGPQDYAVIGRLSPSS